MSLIKAYPCPLEFFELPDVLRHTQQRALLEELHNLCLTTAEAQKLTRYLMYELRLPPPTLSFTGRSEYGHYWYKNNRIVVRPNPRLETFIHELAHHWHYLKEFNPQGRRRKSAPHGWDYCWRLDRLAILTKQYLDQGEDNADRRDHAQAD